MQQTKQTPSVGRRLALGMGTAAAGGMMLARSAVAQQNDTRHGDGQDNSDADHESQFPVQEMGKVIGAQGKMQHGLLHFTLARKDMKNVTGHAGPRLDGPRIPFRPAWALSGDFWFQQLGNGQTIMNGDYPFRPEEVNPAIDAMVRSGMEFQALHQHFMALSPPVFFMHFRATGHPVVVAHGIAEMLNATATPRPQHQQGNPQSPLDHHRLGQILGGHATVGEDGTVTALVARKNRVSLAGATINPYLNVMTNVHFLPLDSHGHKAAVAPDFAMTVGEIMPLMHTMRDKGWAVHCLYNQETGEHPQLYFTHQLKVGDPYELAKEIRRGLDQTGAVNDAHHMAQRG